MASTTLVFTKLLAAQWHYMWSCILYFFLKCAESVGMNSFILLGIVVLVTQLVCKKNSYFLSSVL